MGGRPPVENRPAPSRPSFGNRPPNQDQRPPSNNRPPQEGNRPPGGNRPPQSGHRPNWGGRPPFGGRPPGQGRPPGFRPIQGRPFRYPSGYGYRRWGIGAALPLLFLSSAYYFNNYNEYGLYAPPFGYRWVRYGPDLLLVQFGTGYIADAVYGAFY
jgi:Ni/Co efflux regulator RcnB